MALLDHTKIPAAPSRFPLQRVLPLLRRMFTRQTSLEARMMARAHAEKARRDVDRLLFSNGPWPHG